MKPKYNKICGEVIEDIALSTKSKLKKLNLELAYVNNETNEPVIMFQDWTGNKSKDLLVLHIKDAIRLKSVIDNLIVDFHWHERDKLQEQIYNNIETSRTIQFHSLKSFLLHKNKGDLHGKK